MNIPDIQQPFILPAVFSLVAIFGAWIYYGHRRLWPDLPWTGRRIFRCSRCAEVYVGAEDRPSARCPRCGSYNDAVKR
jgi:hypothetical protein